MRPYLTIDQDTISSKGACHTRHKDRVMVKKYVKLNSKEIDDDVILAGLALVTSVLWFTEDMPMFSSTKRVSTPSLPRT